MPYVPYPFVAIVGQDEARLALTLAAINPRVGGVLLSGPKGTGKTTLVRALGALLPTQSRATCAYGCDPAGTSVCAACAATRASGAKIGAKKRPGEIVELPANAQIDDVVGAIDLREAMQGGRIAFRPGLLAAANRNVLYVDEINLLADVVVDTLLDAAAQGVVRVKRGQHAIEYPSRFTLVGTMNPEEGELRPQITDRIGLRVFVRAGGDAAERAEIFRRNAAYGRDPDGFAAAHDAASAAYRKRLARAVRLLPEVAIPDAAVDAAIATIVRLGIDSHRTEIVALEAAAAHAAWHGRRTVADEDVVAVLPLAARLRRSRLRVEALSDHLAEDAAIAAALEAASEPGAARPPDAAPPPSAGGLVVSPDLARREPSRALAQTRVEGQPVATQPLAGGALDVATAIVDRAVAARGGPPAEPKERVDAAAPPRLTILVVDASLSTVEAAALVRAAGAELLRPVYREREHAALVSCWGPRAEIVVDERTGRNVDLVAARLADLEPGEGRALTPLAGALDAARTIAERFRRAEPGAHVDVAVFSDGRANVPLGIDAEVERQLVAGDPRALASLAAEQCRALAGAFAGRASLLCVNLDAFEAHPLMREIADLGRGRYVVLTDVVARVSS